MFKCSRKWPRVENEDPSRVPWRAAQRRDTHVAESTHPERHLALPEAMFRSAYYTLIPFMRHNQVCTKRNVLKFATAWPGIIACLSAKEGWRELRSHWLAWSQWLVESVWWVTAFDCLFGTFMTVRPCDIERVFRWGAVSAVEDLNTWWGFWLATWAVGSGDELGGYKVRTVARKRCSSFLLSISLEDHQSHASYSHHLFSLPSV